MPITIAHAQIAAALEMIHTGSLIHDDLPIWMMIIAEDVLTNQGAAHENEPRLAVL